MSAPALARRVAAIEERELARAVAAFGDVFHGRRACRAPDDAAVWDDLAREGFPGRNAAAIDAWRASRPPAERAHLDALDASFRALLALEDSPPLRAALVTLAPHLGLPATAAPHLVVRALTAALAASP